MKDVIIVGYSGHAYVLIDALKLNGYNIYGYCDNEEKQKNPYRLTYLGLETKGTTLEILRNYPTVISIGDNNVREQIFIQLQKNNIEIIDVIHPRSAIAPTAIIGRGVHILAAAVVNPFAEIRDGVICNTGSIIEHECKIDKFSHIAPGAVLAGNVQIGKKSFIGANAVIKQSVKIGNHVIIGAGSVVLSDIPDNAIVVGNPAKIIKIAL